MPGIQINSINFLLIVGLCIGLAAWIAVIYWRRHKYLTRIFSEDSKQLFLKPATLEESEQILHALESKFQGLSWASTNHDARKRDLLLDALYKQSRMLMDNKQRALEAAHQRELLHTALRTGEQERERIARSIHDECGIVLTGIKLNLNCLLEETELTQAQKEKVSEILTRLNKLVSTMRRITEDLSSPSLRLIGYFKCIEEVARELTSSQLKVYAEFPRELRLGEERELHLYRITLELLNNIVKHAGAAEIRLVYEALPDGQCIRITHNGRGITYEEALRIGFSGNGQGLHNIEARAQLINARVNYRVNENASSEVVIHI
jgi:two-component system, NarL family, sensor kinase